MMQSEVVLMVMILPWLLLLLQMMAKYGKYLGKRVTIQAKIYLVSFTCTKIFLLVCLDVWDKYGKS